MALRELAIALARAGRYEEAREAAGAIAGDRQRSVALRELADALARAGRFSYAFAVFGLYELDTFLAVLANWVSAFEKVVPGSAIGIVREATGIAGWVRSDWREIHELLSS